MPQPAFEGPNDGHGNQLQDTPQSEVIARTDDRTSETETKVMTADEPLI